MNDGATVARFRTRQSHELAGRAVGEAGHGGAGQVHKWDPHTIAHPLVAGASPETSRGGGATR